MASQSESVDKRCPSCTEPVQSKWKCCPFCLTRLECPSRLATTLVNLPKSPYSNTDVNEIDLQHIKNKAIEPDCVQGPTQDVGIAVVSDCVENPKQNAENANMPDCVDDPTQDASYAVGSDSIENPIHDADDDIGSDNLEITTEAYLRDFKEAVRKGGVANLSDFITDDLNKWRECQINIAVTGESGTGKSSFINAIRGLRQGDACYAQTGTSETTIAIKQYQHPEHHNLVFWDLPGVGTPQFPNESYLSVIDVKNTTFLFWSRRPDLKQTTHG
ncbi:uncharacterized protein LOC127843665 [Dreissena polymorpha]|uniref:IRG-type G domain-containing protein n=1 Tax=Dreissena polymorpha TaxID=45954 RepID=A0A9D4E404_DREPO|nr:uncharacterized protein LOC127843665 [Dreissena polymorpha]KAH3771317.1 hypothetical protein DPMN_172631 [Dreissena polymorpha]